MTERDAKGLLMSANELRQAAEKLRARAAAATDARWVATRSLPHVVEMGRGLDAPFAVCHSDAVNTNEPNAAYIATMHPGVGLALAGWLDDAAAWEGTPNTVNHDMRAHDIARLINGGA